MKNLFKAAVFGTVICIILCSCSIPETKPEPEAEPSYSDVYDLIDCSVVYDLESLKISPWEFVEKYSYHEKYGDVYHYYLTDDYKLSLSLGDTWENTGIYVTDLLSNESVRLCRESEFFFDCLVAERENRLASMSLDSYSPDGKNFVTIKYSVEKKIVTGTELLQFSISELYINGETELKIEGIEFLSDLSWSPDSTLFIISARGLEEMSDPVVLVYDISAQSYTLLHQRDFVFYCKYDNDLLTFFAIGWLPEGHSPVFSLYFGESYETPLKEFDLFVAAAEITDGKAVISDLYDYPFEKGYPPNYLRGIYCNLYPYDFSYMINVGGK